MVVLVIIAILAAIAIPAYLSFIARSKIRTAQSDLSSLALNLENVLQRQLAYPTIKTTTTKDTRTNFAGWAPAQGADFVYTVNSSATGYTLEAHGIAGTLASCDLTIDQQNQREVSGCGSITAW
ncbi:MAG TPA: type IV pilin protein [Rhodocyclaceae bacterium]|nr:type IV pilin protein [Rhodocyclaceae bacterium]